MRAPGFVTLDCLLQRCIQQGPVVRVCERGASRFTQRLKTDMLLRARRKVVPEHAAMLCSNRLQFATPFSVPI